MKELNDPVTPAGREIRPHRDYRWLLAGEVRRRSLVAYLGSPMRNVEDYFFCTLFHGCMFRCAWQSTRIVGSGTDDHSPDDKQRFR